MEMERGPPDGAGESPLPSPTNNKKHLAEDVVTTACTSLLQTNTRESVDNGEKHPVSTDLVTRTCTSSQKDVGENVLNKEEDPVLTLDNSCDQQALASAKNHSGSKEGSDAVKYPVVVLDTTENKAALATAKDFVRNELAMYGPLMEEEEDKETTGQEEQLSDSESIDDAGDHSEDLVDEQNDSYEEQKYDDVESLEGEEEEEGDQSCEKKLKKVADENDTAVFGAEGPVGKFGKEDGEVEDQQDDDLMRLKDAEEKVKELQHLHRNHTLVVSNLQDTAISLQRIAAGSLKGEHHSSGVDTQNLLIRLNTAHKNAAQSCNQYSEVIRLLQDFLRREKEAHTQGGEREMEGEHEERTEVDHEGRDEEASGITRPTFLNVPNAADVNDGEEVSLSRQIHTVSPSQVGHYCKLWEQLREDGSVPEGRDGFFMDNIEWSWDDVGPIGQGAFGTVHLGQPQPFLAVKKVDISRFEADEVVILAQLDHAAVVKLLAVVRDGMTMHICTEYLGDEVVERLIDRGLSEVAAMVITIQLLEGLVYLHGLGIVHRDIKAANAMLCRMSDVTPASVQVKLIDFGSARRIPEGHEWLPGEYNPKGTPTHMSPEMVRGEKHNCTTDIWSLGGTILHMVTGRHPWQKYDNTYQLIYAVAAYPEKILEDIPPHTLSSLQQLLHQCFHQCSKERPSAEVILDKAWEVHRQVSGQTTSTQEITSTRLQSSSLMASAASCVGSLSTPLPPPCGPTLVPPPRTQHSPPRGPTPVPPSDRAQSQMSTKASVEESDPRDLEKIKRVLQELEMEEQEAVPPTIPNIPTPVGSCQVVEDAVCSAQGKKNQALPVARMASYVPTNTLSQSLDLYGTWAQDEFGFPLMSTTNSLQFGQDLCTVDLDLPAGTTTPETDQVKNTTRETTMDQMLKEPANSNAPVTDQLKDTTLGSTVDKVLKEASCPAELQSSIFLNEDKEVIAENSKRAGSQETRNKPTSASVPRTLSFNTEHRDSVLSTHTEDKHITATTVDKVGLEDVRVRSGSPRLSRLACNFTTPPTPKQ